MAESTSSAASLSMAALFQTLSDPGLWSWLTRESGLVTSAVSSESLMVACPKYSQDITRLATSRPE